MSAQSSRDQGPAVDGIAGHEPFDADPSVAHHTNAASGHAMHPALILAILSLASFMGALDLFIVNVALQDIGIGLHAGSLSDLSWVLNAYAIIYASLLVPAGRLADRFGRKGGFLLGVGVFTVASLGCAVANDLWVLVAFRCAQAAGAALLTPTSLGLILTTAPEDKRHQYVKVWATSGALAAATGPLIGGLLVEASWRWIFLVNLPVGILAIVAAARLVPNVRHDLSTRLPDLLGGSLLIVAIGALALGLVKAPDWGWGSTSTVAAFVAALVALGGFLLRSARHAAPVVDLGLLRNRVFAWANLAAALFFVAFSMELLSVVLWLQGAWHYSAIKTGLAMSPGPLMVPVFAVIAEQLVKRVRVGWIAGTGTLLTGAGAVVILASIGTEPHYLADFFPGWMIIGIGVGLALPTIISSATVELPHERSATGSAVVTMTGQIGAVLGISILVAILGAGLAGSDLDAFKNAWWTAGAVGAIGALAAIGLTPRHRTDRTSHAHG